MNEASRALVMIAQALTAALFVWAGTAKIAQANPVRATISALGFGRPRAIASALGVAEVSVGLGLLLLPGHPVTALLLGGLACMFGLAGLLALVRGLHVECACFGSHGAAPLGWRQLALMPVWLAIAVSVLAVPPTLADERVAVTLAVLAMVAVLAASRLMPLYLEHRVQRLAIPGG